MPAPFVIGVLPSSVWHITVVPVFEFVQVTVIGELELPEVGVHEGAVAAPPVMTKSPLTSVLGKLPVGVLAIA